MKILIVSAASSNANSSYNQRLLNLKKGLRQNGIAADMLCLGDYFFKSPLLMEALNIPMIKKEIDVYDAIHGGGFAASYTMGLVKYSKRLKIILDVHGCIEESLLKMRNFLDVKAYFSYLEEFLLQEMSIRRSDFFITCSEPLRDKLLNRGINGRTVGVIRNGVDTDLFKPKNIASAGNKFVVTYAGAFQKWQGIENLVAAATLIKESDVRFRIIGFRKKDQLFKKRLSRLLGAKVELVDSLSQSELVNQLSLSDILIIPRSRNCATQMAFPTKFAEYIATGKPVIVTDVDETATFVRKYKCGFVCNPSAESIAKTIIGAKELSSTSLLDMGINGRKLAESAFDLRKIGKQYYEFLQWALLSNNLS
jgi:glycosyltransferase involved in cell wall biosynthesis